MSTGIGTIDLSTDGERHHHDGVTLGQRVRAARERRGIGVNDLDRAIGTRVGYISKLEADKLGSVGSDKLARLGEVLGVSLDYIVRGMGTLDDAIQEEGARISERHGWAVAVEDARRRHPSIEDRYWGMVGELAGPGLPRHIDAAFVVGLARHLIDAHESQPPAPARKKK